MQWITVAAPPFGWIEQFDKVRAQLGERPAGLQAQYVGTADLNPPERRAHGRFGC